MTSLNVPSPRLRKSRSLCSGSLPLACCGRWRKHASLNAVDVDPAVTVEIDQAHAARHGLGEQVLRGLPIVENEAEARAARRRRQTR